ncbi:MAG: hypothetical protein JNJ73_03835 [Hyphomonadaceae bacterium]|nr:hypothetical protein [Hyphomonadaceae bacterium]
MNVAWLLSALGLLAGAAIGAALVARPLLVRRFIRTETVPVEFRRVYGAALLSLHAAALLFLAANWGYQDALFGAINAGAAAAVGATWMGAAAGRLFALWRANRLSHWRECLFEAALGVLIAAPWFYWLAVALAG